MSVLGGNLLIAAGDDGYQISRSVRTRSSASAYLNRTFGTPTNANKFTFSFWVKRGKLSSAQTIFNVSNVDYIQFNASDNIQIIIGNSICLTTSAVYRDPSAWYHFVFSFDNSASPKWNFYANGVNGGTGTLGSATFNTAVAHYIANIITGGGYFDGCMTEINFIDGQALTPTSFGAFDAVTGVWNPKKYSGTYGTNGFYLNFSDNSGATATTIGKDSSGNGNNWTPNNISVTAGTTYDSMVDVPIGYGGDTGVGGEVRGNYAVANPLSLASSTTLSEANLKGVSSTFNNLQSGTIAVSSGKWYWELTFGGSLGMVGIVPASAPPTTDLGYTATSYGYRSSNGSKYNNGSATAYGNTYTTNDVIGVALDLDNGKLFFSKNNTWQNSGDPAAGTNAAFTGLSGSFMPAAGTPDTTAATWYWNFGQRAFSYTAPSGYKALCTQNLPAPTISNGANYMAASLYTGTGASQTVSNAVNSISFQPDLVWIKSRSAATDHKWTDSVRGVTKALVSNSTAAETTDSTGLTAFGSSGFTVGANTTYNNSGATYVGWQWKGGGTAVTNTAGSITSSVSANTTAGFSVVTYTGTIANATVGHGLGVAPRMIIARNRTNVVNWIVYHANLTSASYYLTLDETNAQTSNTIFWQGVAPTSTVFSLGANSSSNGSSSNIAYCFAPITGYSAFGSYTGNGSSDGPFVYCGFRPRYLFIKRTNSTGNWIDLDTSRSAYNSADAYISLNASSAEATGAYNTDILSNGFKLRYADPYGDVNASGSTYIYAAFAENPFTIARAR